MLPLNLELIQHTLGIDPVLCCGDLQQEMALEDVRLLPEGQREDYDARYLYLMVWDAASLPEHLPEYLVCIGGERTAEVQLRLRGVTAMIFAETVTLSVLMSRLQELFAHYRALYQNYHALLITHSPMRRILDALAAIVGDRVFLLNMKYELLETGSAGDTAGWEKTDGARSLVRAVAEALRTEQLRAEDHVRSVHRVAAAGELPEYSYVRFFDGNQFVAILVLCRGAEVPPLSRALLRCLSNLLQPCIISRFSPAVKLHGYLRSAILSILENGGVSSGFSATLSTIGWEMHDCYQLAYIRTNIGDHRNSRVLLDYHRYDCLFPDSIAVKMSDCVLIIIHNASADMLQDALDNFRQLMTSMKLECCFSLPFDSFDLIKPHYELVRSSLMSLSGQHSNVTFYREFMVRHIINTVSPFLPLSALCHPAARRLREYDRENGTELLMTLEKYLLHNRSLQSAASELFIHRNTMNYRINSIQRIAAPPLDDAHARLHLLVSCIVLGELPD